MTTRVSRTFAALALACASLSAQAGSADAITVLDPYVRLAPPNAPATGAFMVLRNTGERDVRLIKAENPHSRTTELHTHLNENGVMKMRQVPAIDIKAKDEAVLKPGSLHVMLIDMKQSLKAGEVVPITLTFEDGSTKKVEAPVRPIQMEGGMHGHRH